IRRASSPAKRFLEPLARGIGHVRYRSSAAPTARTSAPIGLAAARPPRYTPAMGSSAMIWVAVIVVVLVCVVLLIQQVAGRPDGRLPYVSREVLLSQGELAFFRVLRRSVPPDLLIAPKVRLADLIKCPASARKDGFPGRISQKHVDFVLFDAATAAITLVIELDDRSHQRPDRRDRDAFVDRALAAAGIPILHVPA